MGANGDLLREVFRRVNDREFASLGADLISPDFVRQDLADLFVGVEGQQGVQDGRIAETWQLQDGLGLHRAIGLR